MENNNNENKKIYAFIAIGFIVAGAVAFGVSFAAIQVYALVAAMILEVAAVTFVNIQKKINNLKWLIYPQVAAYAVFAAAILVFVIERKII